MSFVCESSHFPSRFERYWLSTRNDFASSNVLKITIFCQFSAISSDKHIKMFKRWFRLDAIWSVTFYRLFFSHIYSRNFRFIHLIVYAFSLFFLFSLRVSFCPLAKFNLLLVFFVRTACMSLHAFIHPAICHSYLNETPKSSK